MQVVFQEGDVLTLSIGPETFSPVSYNSFVVGPVTASTTVRRGEELQAYDRLHNMLEVLFEAEFEIRLGQHLQRLREAGKIARDQSGAR